MPNTGKPSLDCDLCRARRVKCDLARPYCRRCFNYGAPCPGYRAEIDLLFHNQTASTVTKRRKKKPARKRADPSLQPDALSRGAGELQVSSDFDGASKQPTRSSPSTGSPRELASRSKCTLGQPTLELQLAYSTESRSMALVLERFTTVENGQKTYGWLSFLPTLFQETLEGSCLSVSADLFAQACNAGSHSPVSRDRRRCELYGKSLQAINKALAHPQQSVEDQTVMAIWLLGHYEVMGGASHATGTAVIKAWQVHGQGLTALLRARGPRQFNTYRGRNIFWLAFCIVQTRCIMSNRPCPPESAEWLDVLSGKICPEEQLMHRLSIYAVEGCAILARIMKFAPRLDTAEACLAYPGILKRITDLDAITPDIDPLEWQPGTMHLWNLHLTIRLKLHYWTAFLIGAIVQHGSASVLSQYDVSELRWEQAENIEAARTAADVILSTITLMLDVTYDDDHASDGKPKARPLELHTWVSGMRMTWPLTLVGRLPCLLPRQRELAIETLQLIKVQLGIGHAPVERETPFLFPGEPLWMPEAKFEPQNVTL